MTIATTVLLGILYPLMITGLAQVLFPYKANGQLIEHNAVAMGSRLIGSRSRVEVTSTRGLQRQVTQVMTQVPRAAQTLALRIKNSLIVSKQTSFVHRWKTPVFLCQLIW